MSKHKHEVTNDVDTLAEDARALLAATSEVAGEKVAEARHRLNTALERGKEIYGNVQDQVMAGAKAGDKFIHENPYAVVGIAVGAGALIGYLLSRRNGSSEERS